LFPIANSQFLHPESYRTRSDHINLLRPPMRIPKRQTKRFQIQNHPTQVNRVRLGRAFSSDRCSRSPPNDTTTHPSEESGKKSYSHLIGRYKRIRRKLRRSCNKQKRSQTTISIATPAITSWSATDATWGLIPMIPTAH
jgi:t-SNARE complex subunit (syntaxin)